MACAVALSIAPSAHAASGREHELFDFGWRFQLGDVAGAQAASFGDSAWRALDLPHDWSIEGPYDEKASTGGSGGYLPTGIGWYRKTFTLPEADRGRRVNVEFDGVYQHSTVWVNGHEAGSRPYGYSSFHYDITPFLNFGASPNVIAVRVDNSLQPNSRWYSGSGIFRHTWLTVTDDLRIAPWGVLVTTPDVTADSATVKVRVHMLNARATPQHVEVRGTILDGSGAVMARRETGKESVPLQASASVDIAAAAEGDIDETLVVPAPRLWSPDSPSLYRVRTEVLADGGVVDSVDTEIGIRSVVFDVDRGLLVNGVPVKMRGVCIHQDGGAVGSAVPEAVLERSAEPPQGDGVQCDPLQATTRWPREFYRHVADRMGLMVMDESFDEWTNPQAPAQVRILRRLQ